MRVHTQRPGVFSSYTLTGAFSRSYSSHAAVLIAAAPLGEALEAVECSRLTQVEEAFGSTGMMAAMAGILFENHVARLYCIAPEIGEGIPALSSYKEAIALSEGIGNTAAVVCDAEDPEVLKALKASVEACSSAGKERLAFGSGGEAPRTAAKVLNCERFCVAAPVVEHGGVKSGAFMAAAYAALAVSSDDPAENLNAALVTGDFIFPQAYGEEELDDLILGGVAVFEAKEAGAELVRAVTTKTGTGTDGALHELSAIRIIDDVVVSIREMLKERLRGAKNSEAGREAIRSQVTLELETKKSQERIASYDLPEVYPKEGDPTVCVVEIGFTLVYAMHQIHLVAYVQV